MDNDRKCFTDHVQGNEMLSILIVSHTYSILAYKMDPLVILNQKLDQNQRVPLNQKKVVNRTSTRPKKSPLLRSDDILW
jgi:hypothetical protein